MLAILTTCFLAAGPADDRADANAKAALALALAQQTAAELEKVKAAQAALEKRQAELAAKLTPAPAAKSAAAPPADGDRYKAVVAEATGGADVVVGFGVDAGDARRTFPAGFVPYQGKPAIGLFRCYRAADGSAVFEPVQPVRQFLGGFGLPVLSGQGGCANGQCGSPRFGTFR